MFEWICGMEIIWGLAITGVGVIIGGAGLIVALCFIAYWISELWGVISYGARELLEKIGRVIWVIIVIAGVLAVLLFIIMKAYSDICGL